MTGNPVRTIMENELANTIGRLQNDIDAIDRSICRKYPILNYAWEIRNRPQYLTHNYFSRKRRRVLSYIKKLHGKSALAAYHRLLIAVLMQQSLLSLKYNKLPEGIIREIHLWFCRVRDDFSRQPDTYYVTDKLAFKYDLGVCSLKNLPVGGAWFIQVRRIGLRIFFLENFRDFLKLFKCLAVYTHGVSPFCVIHTYGRYMLRFNQRNMGRAYGNIAQLMQLHPEIKGIYRRSWFLDPELEKVSPELAYLRKVPEQNGAIFFKVRPIEADIRHSLTLSAHRRSLHQAGRYQPAVWAFIWPRESFLSAADENGAIQRID